MNVYFYMYISKDLADRRVYIGQALDPHRELAGRERRPPNKQVSALRRVWAEWKALGGPEAHILENWPDRPSPDIIAKRECWWMAAIEAGGWEFGS